MDMEKAADCLAELGSPSRLAAFRLLVRAGPAGLMVKDIQAHLGVPNSTLSHHISRLVFAGLISQTREGRALRCRGASPPARCRDGFERQASSRSRA